MARDVRAGGGGRVVSGGVRLAPRARYLPIAEHGLIGDGPAADHGIDGREDLPEEELSHLEGYMGSAPVRDRQPGGDPAAARHLWRADGLRLPLQASTAAHLPRRLDGDHPQHRVADGPLGPARRGDLGDARGPPGLHVLPADELGRDRARDPGRPPARPARRHPPLDGGPGPHLQPDHGARLAPRPPGVRPALRHPTCSTPPCCSCPCASSSRPPTRARSPHSTPSPRSWSPTASSTATTWTRRPTGSPARRRPSRCAPSGG